MPLNRPFYWRALSCHAHKAMINVPKPCRRKPVKLMFVNNGVFCGAFCAIHVTIAEKEYNKFSEERKNK